MVIGAQRSPRTDLRGLLTQQRSPQTQLALALQRGGFGVDAPHENEIAQQVAQLLGAGVQGIVGMRHALTFGGQQLHERRLRRAECRRLRAGGACRDAPDGGVGHVPSCRRRSPGSPAPVLT
jgi:hypothetical protein